LHVHSYLYLLRDVNSLFIIVASIGSGDKKSQKKREDAAELQGIKPTEIKNCCFSHSITMRADTARNETYKKQVFIGFF
jgi:hypothetical protein